MLSSQAVLEAASRLSGIVHRTPVVTSRTLNEITGCEVFLKCENFQRIGAFKFRGAYYAVSRLSAAEKAAGVITHSSGNHAQGLALAARLLGVHSVVVMPEDAPENKRKATAAYGAEIVPCVAREREAVTAQLIADHGYTLIHPYDNDDIIAGQGTAALELLQEVGTLDALFVPVGGGGLISGSALAANLLSPDCRVVGVEPAMAADAGRSWRENQIYVLEETPVTIADGLRTRFIGERNLPIMRRYVSDMTSVDEEAILEALSFIWSRLKLVVEPSAAVALAPLLSGQYSFLAGRRVGVLLSGGNVHVDVHDLLRRPASKVATTEVEPLATKPAPPVNKGELRILVCQMLAPEVLAILEEAAPVDVRPGLDLDDETILPHLSQYQALIVGPRQHVSSHVIKYGYNLRVIGCIAARPDNIDVSTARAMGIDVRYAADHNAVAIAEHTMTRLLALSNRFGDGRLAGKTLGIIGFGQAGQQVARRAAAFDMQILVNQPRLTPELALTGNKKVSDLPDLLQQADFISLHVPYRAETETIIGADELELMKPTALLVNCGHTELVDEVALLAALEEEKLAGAGLSALPPSLTNQSPTAATISLRSHPHVVVLPHVTTILDSQQYDMALSIAQQVAGILQTRQTSRSLSLEVVPTEQVVPHEHIDEKRVARLMSRLEEEKYLINPPLTTLWNGRYVILDGATRYASMRGLGFPYLIVQVVDAEQTGFQLHTWYHAISADTPGSQQSIANLLTQLEAVEGLELLPLSSAETGGVLAQPDTICYLLDRQGQVTAARLVSSANRLAVMNAIVNTYNAWGNVERTLLTDLERLKGQFPDLVAVAVYPQFSPIEVFEAASHGNLLPAGLTRFVIPGRILRLNADLSRLRQPESLADKRAWFNNFLAERLSHSRLRYYQEPVVLLDE
jgi:threonine dehydratase